MRLGSDNLFKHHLDLIRHKHVGIVTNHSAVMSSGEHLVDALTKVNGVRITALFGPEHGIRGRAPDRKGIGHGVDEVTGIPVYSLFGKTIKPTARMLKDIDVLLFDIQDVGTRFYTYTTTLALTMEAAAERGKTYIVLDRPNPIGGNHAEGPMLEPAHRSFVGWLPMPVVHGLTVGEIASMINGERWLKGSRRARLQIVRMTGWKRSMFYDETNLAWINPSPSIRSLKTALVYPGTCFIEGTNVSEGRGTDHPFEYIGAPWIDGRTLSSYLNSRHLPGVRFRSIHFTPRSTRTLTTDSKFEGECCHGIQVEIRDRKQFEPVRTGIVLLSALHHLYPEQFVMRARRLDELIGTSSPRRAILKGGDADSIVEGWRDDLQNFELLRRKYLHYR